jgi:nitric oxide synthase-interacting protein
MLLIKSTNTLVMESIAKELVYPTMQCPITGRKIKAEDIIELVPASSGFSQSGVVEATKHVPSIN